MDTFAIWEQGFELGDADFEFASNKLLTAYHAAQEANSELAAQQAANPLELQLTGPEDRPDFWAALPQVAKYINQFSTPWKIRGEMQNHLLWLLQSGKAAAYGFSIPRTPRSVPEKLPADILRQRYVNWGKSAVKGVGLEFVSVRVLLAKQVLKLEAKFSHKSPPVRIRRATGRPTGKFCIEHAIRTLYGENIFPNNYSQKWKINQIRQYVHKLYPGQFKADKGLSDETIRRVLFVAENKRRIIS